MSLFCFDIFVMEVSFRQRISQVDLDGKDARDPDEAEIFLSLMSGERDG